MQLFMGKPLVNIIIPIYKTDIDENERLSLQQCLNVLKAYPITIAKPLHLDVSTLVAEHPQLQVESFENKYFESIYGYNLLMLSTTFYQRFKEYDYILIYQLDAFVFRDELIEWCNRGYDYVGAPWVVKPKYNRFYYKLFFFFKANFYKLMNKPFKEYVIGGRVGNGGFSLRKVSSFLGVTTEKQNLIEQYLENSKKDNIFNEDVFWGLENPQFSYPGFQEALRFSIDHRPQISMELSGNIVPFGCHGWNKPGKIEFWMPFIQRYTAN